MSDQQQTSKLLEIDLNAIHDDEDDEEQSLQPSLSPPSPSSSSSILSASQPLPNDHFQNSLEQKLLELSTKRKQLTQKLSRINEQIVFYEQLKHQHYQQQQTSSSLLLTIPSNERSTTPDTPHIIPETPQSTLTHTHTKMEPSCALLSQNVLIDHPLSSLITNNHDTITKTEAITTTIQNSSAHEDQEVTTQPSIMIDDSQQTTKEEEEHRHHSLTSSISSPPIGSTIIDNQLDPMMITSVNDSQEDIPLIVMDSPDKLHLSSSLSSLATTTTTTTNKKRNRTENDHHQTLLHEEDNETETTTPKKKFARLQRENNNNNTNYNKHEADVDAPNEKMSVKQSTPKKRTLRRPRPTTRSPTSKTSSSPTNVSPKPSITISPKISNSPLLDYSSEDSDNVTQTKKGSALNSNDDDDDDDDHEMTNNEDGVTGFGDGDDDYGEKDTHAITNDENTNKVIVIHNGSGPTSNHSDNNDNDDDEGNSEEEIMFVAPCSKKNESSSSLSSTLTKTSKDNGSIEFDDSDDNNDDEKRVETASQQTKRRGRLATLRKRKSLSQVDKRKSALDRLSKRTKLQSSQAQNNNDDSDMSDSDYTLSSSGEEGVDDNAVNVVEEAEPEEETAPKRRRVVRNKHHKRTGNIERVKVGLDDFIVSDDEEIEFESPDELDKVVEEKVVEAPSPTQSAKITFVSKEGRHVEKEVFTQQLEKEESEDDEENRDPTVSSPEISSGYTSVKSAPFLLRPTTTLSVKGAFMTTCQYFAYSAIYPEWERDVLKDDEKRDHYQPCLIKIFDTVSSIKESLAASSVWTSEMCEEIKQRTFFHHQDFFASSDECCEVCRRSNHEPTFAVSLSGDIIDQGFYSRYTACNPNKYIIQKAPKPYRFVSARICFARVSVYHIMHHYKYFLVRKLKSLISSIKKTEDADVMIQIENSNTFPLLYHGFNTMLSYAEAMSSPRWTRNSSDTTYSTRLWSVLPINRIQASKTATSNAWVETSQSDQPLTGEQPSTSDQEDANREIPPSPVEMPASPVLFSTQDPTPSQVTVSFPLIETKQEETESEGKEKENHVDEAEDNEEEEDDMCILLSDDEDEAMEQN